MKKQQTYPLVSIITVNYNTDEATAELLLSLRHITYPNVEVIVVDNASSKDAGYLAIDFPEITFIENIVNEGFAGGNNRGISIAKGEVILLLNNDTEVAPGFLEPMVELFDTDERIGIISPKIRYYHSPEIIQYAGGEPINQLTARGKFIGTHERDNGQYDTPMQTNLAHGAAMAIKREVLDKIGVLPEMYFLYYEELDFCEHALRAGYAIWYQPQSLILHKESMSVGKSSIIKAYYQNRNRLLFIRRNIFGIKKLAAQFFFVGVSAPVRILKYLLSGQSNFALQIWKGLLWNFKHTEN